MGKPFEAAVRAVRQDWMPQIPQDSPVYSQGFMATVAQQRRIEMSYEDAAAIVRDVFAAALPLDPEPDEVSLAIGLAVHDVHEFPARTYLARVGQAARRALRASLLPGEEPS